MTIRYLSVCSGIEAATQAWHPLGFQPVAFSEIEPFPCAVLAHHYPDVPNRGDMTKFEEWPDDAIDLLVGGTPCQDFSIAGLGKGLDGERGNLMLTYGAMGHNASHQNEGGHAAIAFDTTQITSPGNFSNPKPGDACHPLAAGAHAPAVAFQERGGRADGRRLEYQEELAYALTAPSGGSRTQERNIATPWAVRRLTPTECERLQGFPDDFTRIPYRNKPADQCPDGPRYKALGNSMAVNVMEWLDERIAIVDAIEVAA